MAGYTRQQLIAAKAGVVGVTSFAAGWYLGRDEGDYAVSILVAAAIFGTMAGAYELASAWLASWLGRGGAAPEAGPPVPPVPEQSSPPTGPVGDVPDAVPPLRPRDAVKVLAAFLATQLVVWVVAVLVAALPVQGTDMSAVTTAAVLRVFPVALPLSMLASALTVYLLMRRFSRRPGAGPARTAFALQMGDSRSILQGAVTGALLATLLGILSIVTPAPSLENQGLLAQALSSGPLGRIAFALTAVLLAPPVEEYVFRGVILGALLPTLGPASAGALSGTAFWLLHASEWRHYWPAALGIAAMTALVTVLRLRSRSIVPCIGAHMCYNATLATLALLG